MAGSELLTWAIVGVGMAGRARARAIADDPRSVLVAVWRGRHATETGAPIAPSFETAITQAQAVAVCSPTAFHAAQVRAALAAGKHVVVEYPLAEDADTAETLFATRARATGCSTKSTSSFSIQLVAGSSRRCPATRYG